MERRNAENEITDESIFDLFRDRSRPDRQVAVNRYLWQASLDILSFLPVESADPFSGVIVTGWGSVARHRRLPGDGLHQRPALDARALKVAAFRRPAAGPCRSATPRTARSRTRS